MRTFYSVPCMGDSRRGFGLDIGFTDHLCTQLRVTHNYSAIVNLHSSQIPKAPAKSFPACCAFTEHFLVAATNSENSSASAPKPSLNGVFPPPVSFPRRLQYRTDLVEYESYITTDGRQTVAGLLMWGALSDERTGLSFTFATGLRQRSHSRVRVPWEQRPYFTLSNSKLPFSSPLTTRRVTVEVFDPDSTRG
jgi:hypothetical protein